MTQARALLALAAAGLLAGCAAPAPFNYYVLTAQGQAAGPPGPDARRVAIVQVTVPELADRPQLAVRVAPNRVELSDYHRWGEPLREAVPRVLAEDLERRLGTGYAVSAGPQPGPAETRIAVHLRRFDATAGDEVTVHADWSIRGAQGGSRTGVSRIAERIEGNGHAAVVAAFSRAVDRVAADLAGAIQQKP